MRVSAVFLMLFMIFSDNVTGKIDNWLKLGNKIQGNPSGDNKLSSFNKFAEQYKGMKNLKKHSKMNLRTKWASYQNKDMVNFPLWQKGTVPYHIDIKSYDDVIVSRIEESMKEIEDVSCVLFTKTTHKTRRSFGIWLHITNPNNERECVHNTRTIKRRIVVLTLGIDCMQKQDIIHALMHALGFQDEVTHPQRGSFVRILWENIQPKYRPLFVVQKESNQMLAEYDTTSIMHFHDRAYSINGGPTVIPTIPGLQISPSSGLSQLDIIKLRLFFGQACNKRKFDNLVQTCKKSLMGAASGNSKGAIEGLYGKDSDDETDESEELFDDVSVGIRSDGEFKGDDSDGDELERDNEAKHVETDSEEPTNDKTQKDTHIYDDHDSDDNYVKSSAKPPEAADNPTEPAGSGDKPQININVDTSINIEIDSQTQTTQGSSKKDISSTTKRQKTDSTSKNPPLDIDNGNPRCNSSGHKPPDHKPPDQKPPDQKPPHKPPKTSKKPIKLRDSSEVRLRRRGKYTYLLNNKYVQQKIRKY